MFGTASTGTAIAALSGAAKTNATLAFLEVVLKQLEDWELLEENLFLLELLQHRY